ncbi:hypothetical protein [Agrobacterium sp. lyk4-40-TYG-31]|uniref:hypothetical protein n=1 Tax=Agrobacterium sp. lyk4-40-TYG-31 TaxID=3040276 RepID=UPI00255088A7|nr:hypothetical protein [Agrobacterium sp. lyk4-40-TYG-31]
MHLSSKEIFVLSGFGAILLLIGFLLVMFYRLARRKDFGPFHTKSLRPLDSRSLERATIFGQEARAHLSSIAGKLHVILFVAFAITAVVTGIRHKEIFEVLK